MSGVVRASLGRLVSSSVLESPIYSKDYDILLTVKSGVHPPDVDQ